MKRLLALVTVLAALAALSGCAPSRLGGVTGSLTLTARFSDAQNLVSGHGVQMADVTIGGVTRVALVAGFQAEVTMSIKDGIRIPTAVVAEIAQTSLLGENYVRLTLPPGRDLTQGPYLRHRDRIARTGVAPRFETVVGNAGQILRAVSGDDLATLVGEGALALGGQGDQLRDVLTASGDLAALLAAQRRQLGDTIDGLARIGRRLAADAHAFDPGRIAESTALIRRDKDKILAAVTKATTTARLLNDRVFVNRADDLRLLLQRLDTVLRTLAGGRRELTALIDSLVRFERDVPKALYDGQLLVSAVVKPDPPGDVPWPRALRSRLDGLPGGHG
ncbi:MCE family protein [Actinocorallia sp. API 0066]|uniref:MlaD family protein n=1 Tax=Actinocorallia sp. API 0066 TaxID=2896846 RepID=UPI001E5A8E31|nr:MCE family protein [Actinocorallia sp. API 0066]MCD0449312.1 MCE family protein [Actinocorallia sp. API 0066]